MSFKRNSNRSKKSGLAPGSVVYVGDKPETASAIHIVKYNQDKFEETQIEELAASFEQVSSDCITWISVAGVSDVSTIQDVGNKFNLHPLTLEDIVNTTQRPKFEEFESYGFIVARVVTCGAEKFCLEMEQVSLVIGKNYVISFEEGDDNFFRAAKERVRNSQKLRSRGADYLAYVLLDSIVDSFFGVLESIGEQVEDLEVEVVEKATPATLKNIYQSKRVLLTTRRAAWPLRELISSLERSSTAIVSDGVRVYYRDIYDHIVEIIDIIETVRDMNSGMLDVYLSSVSNKMNAIMKVLTVITTIFMPLTFIAGVYGMNFKYMPELESPYGYPGVLIVMLVIAVIMSILFRRKGWI